MIIGVPRERKILERRVAVTPNSAKTLIDAGHTVLIEQDAGVGSFYANDSYLEAGCQLASSLEEVWKTAELLVKVKEPHESEYHLLREDLIVFTYLHLAGLPDVCKAMLANGATGIAYELVTTEDGRLPLLEPMSDVAGQLAVINGASHLLTQSGGRGLLLGGTGSVPGEKVVVVGGGIAGRASCRLALGLGADVTVLDIKEEVLENISQSFDGKIDTKLSTPETMQTECSDATLLIGAVLIPGAEAPKVVTRDIVEAMHPGTVIVDISIDQGGCVEGIKSTTLVEPTYVEDEVLHYAVPNMPSQTARSSTQALNGATLPYILKIANSGGLPVLDQDPEVRVALNTHKGKLTNKEVSDAVGTEFTPIEAALKS